jgi:hypothetical protein
MAVVQYTGIVNQVRGKLNGSVFNKARNANTLQSKQQQTKGSKGSQSEIRNVFSSVQRNWKTATDNQKIDWQLCADNNPSRDRFGNLTILSGYNQYIKANILRWYAFGEFSTELGTATAPSVVLSNFTLSDLAFTRNSDGTITCDYDIAFDTNNGTGEIGVLFDVSLPISRGVTTYYGRYVFIAGGVSFGTNAYTGTVVLSAKYPVPMSQQRVLLRLRLFDTLSGAIIVEDFQSIIYG